MGSHHIECVSGDFGVVGVVGENGAGGLVGDGVSEYGGDGVAGDGVALTRGGDNVSAASSGRECGRLLNGGGGG